MSITLYHNPRCSKSRQAVAWLEDRDIDFTIVDYVKNPMNAQTLKSVLKKLDYTADNLLRKKEPLYQTLNLKDLNETALIDMMVQHPRLIERPILVVNNRAAIGRPIENFEDLI